MPAECWSASPCALHPVSEIPLLEGSVWTKDGIGLHLKLVGPSAPYPRCFVKMLEIALLKG